MAGMTRGILVALTVVLAVVGVMACSSKDSHKESSRPPTDIVMPDLVGMYWMEAEPQLRERGWRGVLVKAPDVPAGPQDRNRVMTQEPPPGEHINRDGQITVQFGS
jgi:beta-lactam-binding protein with PASTA domain